MKNITTTTASWIDLLGETEGKKVKRRWNITYWLTNNLLVLLGIIFLTAFVLGIIGYSKYYDLIGEPRSIITVIYTVIRMFFFGSEAPTENVLELQIAMALAPLITGYAGLKTFSVIFHRSWTRMRARMSSDHVIICGMGSKGYNLARDFLNSGERVIAIEMDEENKNLNDIQALGGIVIIGSGTSSSILRIANIKRAKRVIATCGKDEMNLEVLIQAKKLKEDLGGSSIYCTIHFDDLYLLTLVDTQREFLADSENFDVSVFSEKLNAARTLFFDHPMEVFWDTVKKDSPPVHLMVVDFSDLAVNVCLQAIKLSSFANTKKTRITVVDPQAEYKLKLFREQYPQVGNIVDIDYTEEKLANLEIDDEGYHKGKENHPLAMVIFGSLDPADNIKNAIIVQNKLKKRDMPLLLYLKERKGYNRLFEESQLNREGNEGANIFSFGNLSRTCTRELVVSEKLDSIARTIHEDYVSKRGETDNPWSNLSEYIVDANRQQADHILIKLRSLGLDIEFDDHIDENELYKFEEDDVEMLARMEHARWNNERWLNGWVYGKERDRENKISPYLVPYDDLSDEIQEYDREAVRNIPWLLSKLNLKIIKK